MGGHNLVCRFCLKEDLPETTSFSLLDDKNAKKILELENLLFLKLSLLGFNFYPTHVCCQCIEIIENFLTMKRICLENEMFLFEHKEDIKEHGLAFVKKSKMSLEIKEEMEKETLENNEEIDSSNFTILDYSHDIQDDVIKDYEDDETSKNGSSKNTKKIKTEECNPLDLNLQEIKKGKQYSCPKCSYLTKHNFSIERHIKRVHRQNRPFSCQFCGKSFVSNIALNNHMKRAHDIYKESCKICYKMFRSDMLPEHSKSCTSLVAASLEDPNLMYKMRMENKSFKQELKEQERNAFLEEMGPLAKNGNLRIHNALTEPIPIGETTKDSLLRHKTEMSAKIPCEVCGAFTRRDWMRRHLRNLHGIGDKKTMTHVYPKLQCPKCPKKISTLGLAKHMKTVHSLRGALDMLVGCHMCGEKIQCTHMDYHVRNICIMRKAEKLEKESRPDDLNGAKEESTQM